MHMHGPSFWFRSLHFAVAELDACLWQASPAQYALLRSL